jgi:CheY-like chemotaxis protein
MKILIVEDDTFFQKFYSQKLSEAGYQVEVAGDGNQGLIKMASSRPDLILLDIIMPVKDGFDVLQAKSQDPQLKSIPAIIFSTLGDENDVKKALQLGAVDYINKSFHDVENLKRKIASHIGQAPQQPVPQSVQQQQSVAQPPQSNGTSTGST